jgi:hypothetical protein
MKYLQIAFFVLVAGLILFSFLTISEIKQTTEKQYAEMDSANVMLTGYMIELSLKTDSLKHNEQILTRSILYLDSCQQTKATKADRAERRGRFLGGLLKTIFPAL